jgi:hypothetical protein
VTKALVLIAAATIALIGSTGAAPTRVKEIRALSIELVGQFQNSPPDVTPPTHAHYGYLPYVRGLSAFKGAPANETTALFTFFADAATVRVTANGPLRIVTRIGKLTIYRDLSTNGDFGQPETFRDGTPVLVAQFRQLVVNNTVTGSFTTFHRNTIVSNRPFAAGRETVRLGRVGGTFRTSFSGQGNMPGPPSGFFGGYAVSG